LVLGLIDVGEKSNDVTKDLGKRVMMLLKIKWVGIFGNGLYAQ